MKHVMLPILSLPNHLNFHKQNIGNDQYLQLSPITVNEDYRRKWNIHENDFVCLTRNGELVNNSLYRVGGLNTPNLKKDYFMLLKQVEALYSMDIMKMSKSKDPRHLESRWCIIDKNGIEKVECSRFKTPYLIGNSCIYSTDGNYYNIETDEFYCHCHHSIASSEFLFLENSYDKDESRRGVMKINKKDGTWELFPSRVN